MQLKRAAVGGPAVRVLIAVHVALVAWCALRYGFTGTEVGLLPAGILDWQYRNFDVFRVNPPLVRMWGTLPVLALDPEIPFSGVFPDPRRRAEFQVAMAMLDADADAAHRWLVIARLFCLPFTVAGMWVAARWAGELYGRAAGLGAAALWAFLPNMIGYGCLISGDAQAASMGLVTFYLFRNWLARPGLADTYGLGIVVGLTMLTKSSWLILLGLLPMLWIVIRLGEYLRSKTVARSPQPSAPRSRWRGGITEMASMCLALAIALFVVNLLYGFAGSFRRLDSYDFISKTLAGSQGWELSDWSGNRFRGTLLGMLPVPLPEDLVIGVDLQKWDFDRERWSYFRGQWRDHGWWNYYLYGLAIKLPLGFWLLFLIGAVGFIFHRSWRGPWREELLLWTPMVLIVTAASLETGLNRHLRYVLPALAFSIVLASRAFRVFHEPSRTLRAVVVVATAWMIASSLWIYPHSLSYFNEFVGGPRRADEHLNASNLDWGQDLPYLRRWQQDNPMKRPLWVTSYLETIRPGVMGIEAKGEVPRMEPPHPRRSMSGGENLQNPFKPGWYAVDRETLLQRSGGYDYLRRMKPSASAGYGFQIFEITPQRAAEFERQWREMFERTSQ